LPTWLYDKIGIIFTHFKTLLWLYEYIFQMWRIDPYALCIRTFNRIWNMYS
jgi:hypothetical protein